MNQPMMFPPQMNQPTMSSEWPRQWALGENGTEVADSSGIGQRLDAFLAGQLAGISRASIQRAIAAGHCRVNGKNLKPSYRLEAGDEVVVDQVEVAREGPEPEDIPLDLLYEDEHLVAVNKPAGMIVHPAKGHWAGTLAAALAYHFQTLSQIGGPTRPGIVHRLDRDTSGVIVVARTDQAHAHLAEQFKARTVQKEYLAIVRGVPDRDADVVDRPIGNHPHIREQMAIREGHESSRPALTKFEVIERFERFALLRVLPKTGRTHQIRVHLASVGLPVLCDKLYGGGDTMFDDDQQVVLARHALHARRLELDHPATGERLTFEAPLPADMQAALQCLRR